MSSPVYPPDVSSGGVATPPPPGAVVDMFLEGERVRLAGLCDKVRYVFWERTARHRYVRHNRSRFAKGEDSALVRRRRFIGILL